MSERAPEPTPTIRRAVRADAHALGRLGALMVQEHHDFDPRRFLAPGGGTAEHYGAFLASQVDEPEAAVLVAEDASGVVGYAYTVLEGYDYMALRGPAGVLHDVIVAPGHRGRGVGRLLVESVLELLRSRGAERVVLSTAVQNGAAQRLFAHLGFRATMIEMTRELGDGPDRDLTV